MRFTVFGGAGFIGGHLVRHLENRHEVTIPPRDTIPTGNLGHVIYAIGLTADFRQRPIATIDAHVNALVRRMEHSTFDSWLYLSSTRLYSGLPGTTLATEDTRVPVLPNADSVYDLSKLLGESLCLSQPSDAVRVARVSNIYSTDQSSANFLGSIIASARTRTPIVIQESPDSRKDYLAVSDLCCLIEAIAMRGRSRIYNVASGNSVTHEQLARHLTLLTGIPVTFNASAPRRRFADIDIARITSEFDFRPRRLLNDLSTLVAGNIA